MQKLYQSKAALAKGKSWGLKGTTTQKGDFLPQPLQPRPRCSHDVIAAESGGLPMEYKVLNIT